MGCACLHTPADGTIAYENLSFPELCQRELEVNIPDAQEKVSIEGWLLCLSMRNARAFGPYLPDSDALATLRQQAVDFWESLCAVRKGTAELNAIPHAQGVYPLCACCTHAAGCPKFPQAAVQPHWEPALDKLGSLRERRAELDAEIREVEDALRLAHRRICTEDGNGDWITTGNYRFRVSRTHARCTLDREALRDELNDIFQFEHLEDIDVDALLARHEQVGSASSRLLINKLA